MAAEIPQRAQRVIAEVLTAPVRCIAMPRLVRCGYPFNHDIHNQMSEYFDHFAIVRTPYKK